MTERMRSCIAMPKEACAREVSAIRRALPKGLALVAGGPRAPFRRRRASP